MKSGINRSDHKDTIITHQFSSLERLKMHLSGQHKSILAQGHRVQRVSPHYFVSTNTAKKIFKVLKQLNLI